MWRDKHLNTKLKNRAKLTGAINERMVSMNHTIETILTRRSIRKYKTAPISPNEIQLMLEAAMSAPSANNQKPWHFMVITESDKLTVLASMHGGARFIKDAPLAIVVFGDPSNATLPVFWREDCAAATENILLAGHSLGIGGTWIGVGHTDVAMMNLIQHTLSVPERYIPFSVLALGYPAEQRDAGERYLSQRVHNNQW